MIRNDMSRHYFTYKDKSDKAVINVLESGWYITGNELN